MLFITDADRLLRASIEGLRPAAQSRATTGWRQPSSRASTLWLRQMAGTRLQALLPADLS